MSTCYVLVTLLLANSPVAIPWDTIREVRPYNRQHSTIRVKDSPYKVAFWESEDEVYKQMEECWKQEIRPFYDWLDSV